MVQDIEWKDRRAGLSAGRERVHHAAENVVNCKEFDEQLVEFVAGALSPAVQDEFALHRFTCGECQANLVGYGGVIGVVGTAYGIARQAISVTAHDGDSTAANSNPKDAVELATPEDVKRITQGVLDRLSTARLDQGGNESLHFG